MGIRSCYRTKESSPSPSPSSSNSASHFTLHSESSSSSSQYLSSQPSLPSVPSLTSPFPEQKQESPPITAHHQCLATLKAHSSYISCLALAGKFLYSGSSDGEIRAWSLDSNNTSPTPSKLVAATTNGAGVKSIVILGDKLFSAHQDNKIRVWKIDNNNNNRRYECIAKLPTLNDRFLRCFSANNYIQVRRHKKCTWVHHVDAVSAIALSTDASLVYSASWDRTFKIWKTSSFRCLESVQNAHDDAINAIVVSSDGYVYTGSADKKIKVWKKKKKKKNHIGDFKNKHSLVTTLEKHKSAVNALALSTEESFLYSGACDRSILVWEKESGGEGHMALRGALRGHTKAILCLAVVNDLLCSGSADNTVRLWRRGSGYSYSCLTILEGHRKPVKCLTVVADGGDDNGDRDSDSASSFLVYSGSLDRDIKVWRIRVPVP